MGFQPLIKHIKASALLIKTIRNQGLRSGQDLSGSIRSVQGLGVALPAIGVTQNSGSSTGKSGKFALGWPASRGLPRSPRQNSPLSGRGMGGLKYHINMW
jgi:hypothetical protein